MVLYYTYIFGTNEHMVLILLVTKITAIWVLLTIGQDSGRYVNAVEIFRSNSAENKYSHLFIYLFNQYLNRDITICIASVKRALQKKI